VSSLPKAVTWKQTGEILNRERTLYHYATLEQDATDLQTVQLVPLRPCHPVLHLNSSSSCGLSLNGQYCFHEMSPGARQANAAKLGGRKSVKQSGIAIKAP